MNKRLRKKEAQGKTSNKERMKYWKTAYMKAELNHSKERSGLLDKLVRSGRDMVEQKKICLCLEDKNVELTNKIGRLLKENANLKDSLSKANKPFWRRWFQ